MTAPGLIRLALAVAAALLTTGCLGDPPPDPETASLEVVVGSSMEPDQPCLLNRPEVAAGQHDFTVIGESGGPVTAVLRDSTGAVVFEADGTVSTSRPPSVTLVAGPHVVQCLSEGELLGEVPLRVVPAGP